VSKTCIENKGFILAPQVGFEPTTLRLTAERIRLFSKTVDPLTGALETFTGPVREPILYGWREGSDHYWCGDRSQGDVWCVDKPRVNDLHPTMKPVELIERAIHNSSRKGDLVLDPFGGSGSTLIACERTGRRARMLELDPVYVDVMVRRWQECTGKEATLEGDGRSFRELCAE
jgi:hypothetical protein